MKTLKPICLALLVPVLGLISVHAAEDFRTDINPALIYYKAILMDSKEDTDFLINKEWRGERLPAEFGQRVSSNAQLKFIRQAGRQKPRCDWGVDFTPGPETLLPQLAAIKRLAWKTRFHAMWSLQCGEQEEGKEDLIAMVALGRNISTDGVLISDLVQFAVESMACTTVAENYYQISPETLKKVADGFDAAPPRGTVADAVLFEKKNFAGWIPAKIREWQKQYPGDDAKVLRDFTNLVGQWETNSASAYIKAAAGSSEGLIKLCNEASRLYDQEVEILRLALPAYETRVKEFNAQIEKLNNPLASELLPGLDKSRKKEFSIIAELAMVRAAAEYHLHGEAGLKSVADPCGNGPFAFERFVFQGVDRGFKLTSAYKGYDYPTCLIFVEKDGPAFKVVGKSAGKPVDK